MSIFSKIFKSDNTRSLEKIEKVVQQIEALEEKYAALTDADLADTTRVLKERLEKGETLDDILPDAFATVREAGKRVLNMRAYHSQLIGGVVLHQGRIAEMKTGEGKTLVSTFPAYLNALTGQGVHIVTANEYLAQRDAQWMGKVHKFLGLTVGVTMSGVGPEDKKKNYACDITYGTSSEFGFDYLRDNMVSDLSQKVQRGHVFVLVDEVDSILIDVARDPLIISGRGLKSSDDYKTADKFVKSLKEDDYEIDEERDVARLTEEGIEKAEKFYKLESLYDVDNMELNQFINNALIANTRKKRDTHYIVKDGEVILVDGATGRLMPGRRLSEGLHQAIEAKEGVEIKDESATLATITLQNYFRMYKKLSGMTGTAKTEETEFRKIYGLDVVTIPTNKPVLRIDETDIVYPTVKGKFNAVVERIKEAHEIGQPVLVGTVSVQKSEELSEELKKAKIKHTVLNAKNHELESMIVAQAGKFGAVTIATNMAGRGTDILLGGNPEYMAKQKLKELGYNDAQIELATSYFIPDIEEIQKAHNEYEKYYAEYKVQTDAEKEKVKEVGGLLIIGTERHESRRIDNQLRGRAGRQGDPGRSVFYISLEDDLSRIFGGSKIKSIANFFKLKEDEPIQMKLLSKAIETAQKRVEGDNYSRRRYLIEFDDVLNLQRNLIYAERDKVLAGINMHSQVCKMLEEQVEIVVDGIVDPNKVWSEWDLEEINAELEENFFEKGENFVTEDKIEDFEVPDLLEMVKKEVMERFETKRKEFDDLGLMPFEFIERVIMLRVVNHFWMEHIDRITILKREIRTQSFGNQDPIIPYKKEAAMLFNDMVEKIDRNVAMALYKMQKPVVEVREKVDPYANVKAQQQDEQRTNSPESVKQAKSDKVCGRNDPCPCGSGKKYKNCCGKND